jgi:hypothetical protein
VSAHELILERSLLGSIAALLPVPWVDDFLLRRSRRSLFVALARRHELHVSSAVLDVLVEDRDDSLVRTIGVGVLGRLVRYAGAPLRVAGRARAALETFELATLFDHYARAHHAGLDLDPPRAKALRAAMDDVAAAVRLGLSSVRDPRAHADALCARFDERWGKP